MTPVIKSGDLARIDQVRALGLQARPLKVCAQDVRVMQLEAALQSAIERADGLQASLAAITQDHGHALSIARSQGEETGRKAADDGAAALAVQLEAALERAAADFASRMDRLTEGAGFLAGIALERIVGDVSGRGDLIAQTIGHAHREFFGEDAIRIDVSHADFPDRSHLDRIVLPPGCEICVSDTLQSGDCLVHLKLGRIDLGLDGQVQRLRAELAVGAPV